MRLIRRNLFTGKLEEIEFEPAEEFPKKAAKRRTRDGLAYNDAKPLRSRSAGCHPSQVAELREFIRHRGIRGTEVSDEGRVSFTSRQGRKDYNIATHTLDGDAGYGDHGGR